MRIENGRVVDPKVKLTSSPNVGGTFAPGLPDVIVLHYTAGRSGADAVRWLCDPRSKASAHFVVDRDGSIAQLVPLDTVAWHAGASAWQGRTGMNRYSIGIEIVNAGRLSRRADKFVSWFGAEYPEDEVGEAIHRNETASSYWHRYTEPQLAAVFELCASIVAAFGITALVGHEEIAPGRKTDPGPLFPLEQFRERILTRNRGEDASPAQDATAPESARREAGRVGLVTAEALNVRSGADGTARLVAPPIARGTLVEIRRERGGWYEVQYQVRGWVNGTYVKT